MPEPTARDRLRAEIQEQFDAARAAGDIIEPSPMGVQPPQEPVQPMVVGVGTPATPSKEPEPTPGPSKQEKPKADEPRIFGKYADMSEAEKGYYHMVNQASRVADENKQLKERLALLNGGQPTFDGQSPHVPGGSPGADPRVNPLGRTPDWRNNGAVVKLAENVGLDPSIVAEFAQSLYEPILNEARTEAQKAIAPIHAQAAADAYMRQRYPEVFQFTQELGTFIKTADPTVQRTFQNLMEAGNYEGASEYAWLTYRQQMGSEIEGRAAANAQVTEEQRQQARANAGLAPTSPGTPVHAASPSTDGPSPDVLEATAKAAREGNWDARQNYLKQTIGTMLKRDPQFQKILERHNREHGLS